MFQAFGVITTVNLEKLRLLEYKIPRNFPVLGTESGLRDL